MADLGAVKAMNLDGGSSASLYYDGQAIYGRVDKEGKEIIRPIKSVLSVIKL
jgi:exopolysaccharide biosynthesis protein